MQRGDGREELFRQGVGATIACAEFLALPADVLVSATAAASGAAAEHG
ncbi:hypothetical protein ABZ353_26685 [Streptomyces niveus]